MAAFLINIIFRKENISVFVKNLIRFPIIKNLIFIPFLICFIARITWFTTANITES